MLAAEDLEGAIAVLAPASERTGVGAVEQLLRQTRERLEETTRRIEAVTARVKSLGEAEPQQALQLLTSQPAAIRQHSQIKALRTRLEAQVERQAAIRSAVEQSKTLDAKGNLRDGMEALEAVRRAYGSSPELTAAITAYTLERERIASDEVQLSIADARQAILNSNGSLALAELRKSADVLEFAEPALQTDWNRLGKEASRTQPAKTGTTATLPTMAGEKPFNTRMVGGIAAGVLVVASVIGWLLTRGSSSATGPSTFLQLNAEPFAEVVSVTRSNGKPIALPKGEHTTPLRLDALPEQSYTVVFKGPDGRSHTKVCNPADDHLCVADLGTLNDAQIDEILTGSKQ